MKITNDGSDARVYPTLGVILQAGESIDDATAKITTAKVTTTITAPSASSDTTVEEVK